MDILKVGDLKVLGISCGGFIGSHVVDILCARGLAPRVLDRSPERLLCLSIPYGPRQGHTGVAGIIRTYLSRHLRHKPAEIWGDGNVVGEFLNVSGLVERCARRVLSREHGVFNTGSGAGTSILRIVEIIGRSVGRQIPPTYRPGLSFDVPRVVLDVSRADVTSGWERKIPFGRGSEDRWKRVRQQDQSLTGWHVMEGGLDQAGRVVGGREETSR